MELVTTWDEIKENIETFDEYRWSEKDNQYYRDKIRDGICFIVTMDDNGNRRFYPSRYIGYINNSREKHESDDHYYVKHGKFTNEAISKILGKAPETNEQLLHYFKEFCEDMDIEYREYGAAGSTRKFWVYN